ncbi:MAG: glycosyltransferase family 9 protein [Acidobacteriota bacterium]|nr:glycosyltransferase family 9 protein [Acidobacteriota bacterium]
MAPPRRILLLNGSHIGDIVIATSVLPILRAAYPDAEIGFVTGSWSRMVIEDHPGVTYAHCVDHWRFNRSADSFHRKVLQFRRTRRTALREIRALKYDVALCLYTHFPDLLDISYAARIPVRVGFRASVFSSLATALVEEPNVPFIHQGARLAELLKALPIDPAYFRLRRSSLAPDSSVSLKEVCTLLESTSPADLRYRIIHMGSGAPQREFPVSFWRELAETLSPECTLLFTGRGRREMENITAAMKGLKNCINACDRLSWNGFVAAVRHAEVVYGVESMAGHVAAAVGAPCAVVYGGAAGVARWRPEGKDCIVVTNHVPCAPCLQPHGCAAMTCTQGIRPDDLVRLGPSVAGGPGVEGRQHVHSQG